MSRNLVIVGGLVPSMIIDQSRLPADVLRHPGTVDMDLGIQLAVLEGDEDPPIEERLFAANIEPREEDESLAREWIVRGAGVRSAPLDFLVPIGPEASKGGVNTIRLSFWPLETEGLELAFADVERVHLKGLTLDGEIAEGDVQVCGPGAYVVLKALAFRGRPEPKRKDAFDLWFVMQYYGSGIHDVVDRFVPLLGHQASKKAIEILQEDFIEPGKRGPTDVCRFMGLDDLSSPDAANVAADVVGTAMEFLRLVGV